MYVYIYMYTYVCIKVYKYCYEYIDANWVSNMVNRQLGIHWSGLNPLTCNRDKTKLRHWMTKGRPAISIPRAATSVQIKKRTLWTRHQHHHHPFMEGCGWNSLNWAPNWDQVWTNEGQVGNLWKFMLFCGKLDGTRKFRQTMEFEMEFQASPGLPFGKVSQSPRRNTSFGHWSQSRRFAAQKEASVPPSASLTANPSRS